jgi:elongation factor 3
MSPVATITPSEFSGLLKALKDAPTAPDAKGAADMLARAVKKAGPASLK